MLAHKWIRLCASCTRLVSCQDITRRGCISQLSNRRSTFYLPTVPWASSLRRYLHSDLYRNASVQMYLRQLVEEYRDVTEKLQHGFLSDPGRKELSSRRAELSLVADAFQCTTDAVQELEEVKSLLLNTAGTEDEDKQMTQLLKEEQIQITQRIEALESELIRTIVPSDPHDNSDVFLEVVSGRTTGGDICQQFTREMFDMYQGLASYRSWEFEVFNYTPAEFGGLHHAAVRVAGDGVYGRLKHEGGTHRVQRIPEVGLSSRMQRIHTGTMTVIVLPQPRELDVSINPKDLRIDTFRARGAGGQHVNTTDSAVRIVHLPTGTAVECQQSRSQLKNRDTAMQALRARLYQSMMGKQTEQTHMARKQQVGTRAQADRIRSYNFSQDRVTDHRSGYTTRDIKEFMKGGEALDELISDLLQNREKEALLELVESCSRRPSEPHPRPASSETGPTHG